MGLGIKKRKWIDYIVILLCYVAAAWIGMIVFQKQSGDLWFKVLMGDMAATFFIWIFSMLLQNASLYDPYWSVQPIVILSLLLLRQERFDIGSVLICMVILFWGIRLTANWFTTFDGLGSQDWRYDQLKAQTGRLFQVVNLIGIQLMPTFIVFLCILPAAYYMELDSSFSLKNIIGLTISMVGALIQLTADVQMHNFRKRNADRSKIIRSGLWKYSRHPNYLGEILMWWGIYLTFVVVHVDYYYLGVGAIVNTLLFLLISIPMAEKHLASYKEGYEEYRNETRKLLPVPKSFLILKH